MATGSSNATVAVAASSSDSSDIIPKSVITICILVAGFLLGVLVAKLVNYCYNRADVPDNASDISEHTKGLLRIQLALLKFGKGGAAGAEAGADPEEAKRQQQATVLSMWKMKAMNKAAVSRAQAEVEGTAAAVVNEVADGGNKRGNAAAGAKGAAKKGVGSASAGARPKTFVRPKKLFPNSLAGVAPATATATATATALGSATATEPRPASARSSAAAAAKARSRTPPLGKSSEQPREPQ